MGPLLVEGADFPELEDSSLLLLLHDLHFPVEVCGFTLGIGGDG